MTRTEYIARRMHREAYLINPARDASEMVPFFDSLHLHEREVMMRTGWVVEEVVKQAGHLDTYDLQETLAGALTEDYFPGCKEYELAPNTIKHQFRLLAQAGLNAYMEYGMGESVKDHEVDVKVVKL